jgi:hypothetical protein
MLMFSFFGRRPLVVLLITVYPYIVPINANIFALRFITNEYVRRLPERYERLL